MDSAGRGPGSEGPHDVLPPQSLSAMGEGISLVFSRWTALQMAVENGWGGRDSRLKYEELASSIVSWFSQSKDLLYIDDLENMLDDSMQDVFNTEVTDGSIEEVAEQLMIMYEDCLKGSYESIQKLRLTPTISSVSRGKQVVLDESEDESEDEEASEMMVDEPKPTEMSALMPKVKQVPDEDGWSTVTSRKNRNRK